MLFRSAPDTSLALSSRNAYLTPAERQNAAPALYAALDAARGAWNTGMNKAECVRRAHAVVQGTADALKPQGVQVKLDYVEMNDPESFDVLVDEESREVWERGVPGRPVVLSGAMWVGKTRLIDNVILGDEKSLGILAA